MKICKKWAERFFGNRANEETIFYNMQEALDDVCVLNSIAAIYRFWVFTITNCMYRIYRTDNYVLTHLITESFLNFLFSYVLNSSRVSPESLKQTWPQNFWSIQSSWCHLASQELRQLFSEMRFPVAQRNACILVIYRRSNEVLIPVGLLYEPTGIMRVGLGGKNKWKAKNVISRSTNVVHAVECFTSTPENGQHWIWNQYAPTDVTSQKIISLQDM